MKLSFIVFCSRFLSFLLLLAYFADAFFAKGIAMRKATSSQLLFDPSKGTTFDISSIPFISTSTYNTPHVRWFPVNSHTWELQTAVTRWQHPQYENSICELHAMVHYGAFDYYQYYNKLCSTSTTLLFELLTDQEQFNAQGQLLQPVQATPYDRAYVHQYNQQLNKEQEGMTNTSITSNRYQMCCQVDALQYQQSHWYHADWTRQELQAFLSSRAANANSLQFNFKQQPLWKRTTSQTWSNVAQAALVQGGPPLSSLSSQERRLFTHLFWPGGSFAGLLRTLLWCTVPSPELSILVFDTSTLFSQSSSSTRLGWTSLPIVQILLSGQWFQVKWLLMGQELVQQQQQPTNTSSTAPSDDWIVLRNQKAINVLQNTLDQHMSRWKKKSENQPVHTFALLYGCQHMSDLQRQLTRHGWQPQSTQWRTAWTIRVSQSAVLPQYLAGIFASTTYLSIGAMDWIDVWTNSLSGTTLALYVARHVLLYVGLSRLFLDWTTESS